MTPVITCNPKNKLTNQFGMASVLALAHMYLSRKNIGFVSASMTPLLRSMVTSIATVAFFLV